MTNISFSWQHAVVKSDLPATTKHLLLTINVHLNPKGEGAFPSYSTLAQEMGVDRRTVIRHMEKALEAGFIIKTKTTRENGSNGNNQYRACPEILHHPSDTGDTTLVAQCHHPSDTGDTSIITNQYNKPIKHNPPTPPKGEHLFSMKPDFVCDDIWKDFVKHRGGKKFTKLAAKRIVNKLEEFHQQGCDCNEILNTSIERGWKGVFKPKGEKNDTKRFTDKDIEAAITKVFGSRH